MILFFVILSCVFSGIVAIDVIIKNRRVSKRDKLNRKTRMKILDELYQKQWDNYLYKKYSTFPSWYIV